MVCGVWFVVWGLGFGVWDLGFMVCGLWFVVWVWLHLTRQVIECEKRMNAPELGLLSSEHGTYKTVKTRFWSYLTGQSP